MSHPYGNEPLEVDGTGTKRVPDGNDVVVGGKIIGRDPDPNVRAQLEKEYHSRNAGGGGE